MYFALTDLLWLALLCTGLLYWWHTYKLKEAALVHVKRHCKEMELQLLDQSISLKKITLMRAQAGHLQLRRLYSFSFSSNGDDRYHGTIELHGKRIKSVQLEPHRI